MCHPPPIMEWRIGTANWPQAEVILKLHLNTAKVLVNRNRKDFRITPNFIMHAVKKKTTIAQNISNNTEWLYVDYRCLIDVDRSTEVLVALSHMESYH